MEQYCLRGIIRIIFGDVMNKFCDYESLYVSYVNTFLSSGSLARAQ